MREFCVFRIRENEVMLSMDNLVRIVVNNDEALLLEKELVESCNAIRRERERAATAAEATRAYAEGGT